MIVCFAFSVSNEKDCWGFSIISSPDKSYTKKLLNDKNLSVSKVKEEMGELIESVEKDSNKIHEAADVIYHLMVYLEANNIKIEEVMNELKKRQK